MKTTKTQLLTFKHFLRKYNTRTKELGYLLDLWIRQPLIKFYQIWVKYLQKHGQINLYQSILSRVEKEIIRNIQNLN